MNAKRRVEYTRQLLASIGLEGQRLQMIYLSSAMGGQFAFAAAEFTAEIQRLGPNPLRRQVAPAGKGAAIASEQPAQVAQQRSMVGEQAAIEIAGSDPEREAHEH